MRGADRWALVFGAGVVAAAAVVVASAGGSDDPVQPAATHEAEVEGVTALPSLRVAVGEEAVFRNSDDVEHTFTADGGLFDSGRVAPGGTFRFSFPAAGELTYHCEIHPSMTGRIVVGAGASGS